MSVATGSGEAAGGAGGGGARVFFQSSPREGSATPGTATAAAGQVQQQRRHQQGKVTVKYDRKELRKRLVLEEWIVEQLGQLYGCEEEEMPDVEIDIDDLLDTDSEEERALKLQEALVDCYKPTEGQRLPVPAKPPPARLLAPRKERSFKKLGDQKFRAPPRPSLRSRMDSGGRPRVPSSSTKGPNSPRNSMGFIKELLSRIRGMRKLSPPQKKNV